MAPNFLSSLQILNMVAVCGYLEFYINKSLQKWMWNCKKRKKKWYKFVFSETIRHACWIF